MTESTTRVEAFSDGVFAIAITLLILEISIPHSGPHGADSTLWVALAARWPSYLAFVMSFFVILITWVNHHELMRLVRAVDYPFLFANGFVLLMVTFVPFPTAVLAQHLATPEAAAAVAFYCATFVIISLSWVWLFHTIHHRGLLHADVDAATVARIRRAYAAGPIVYSISTLVAFFQPVLGLALNTSLWLLWIRLCYQSTHVASDAVR
jgi:uncharacterized membrane protein